MVNANADAALNISHRVVIDLRISVPFNHAGGSRTGVAGVETIADRTSCCNRPTTDAPPARTYGGTDLGPKAKRHAGARRSSAGKGRRLDRPAPLRLGIVVATPDTATTMAPVTTTAAPATPEPATARAMTATTATTITSMRRPATRSNQTATRSRSNMSTAPRRRSTTAVSK